MTKLMFATLGSCFALASCDVPDNSIAQQVEMVEDMRQLEPGRWVAESIVSQAATPGMSDPAFERRRAVAEARTQTGSFVTCLRPADLARPQPVLFSGKAGADCRLEGLTMRDGKLDARLACAPGGDPSMEKRITGRYTTTSYQADTRLAMLDGHLPGGAVDLVAHVSARRTGRC